jgi:hypothetical protein
MFLCIICHFEAELDDVAATATSGRCVCLRCYARVTDTERPMPKTLRRAVRMMLEDSEQSATA